jgi:hypothetical protein
MYFIISPSFLLRREIFHTKVIENENISFCSVIFLKNITGYEVMWKNIVDPDSPQMTVWCVCVACWV